MHEFTQVEKARRLESSLARIQERVRDGGHSVALGADLYILERIVQVAIDSEAEGLVDHAFVEVRLFEKKLLKAPAFSTGGTRADAVGAEDRAGAS